MRQVRLELALEQASKAADSFWSTTGLVAIIGAVAGLAGALGGGAVALVLDRRQHQRQNVATLQAAVSAFLTAGSDLVAACERLVGRQRVARVAANNDEGLAADALRDDEDYKRADRELEDVYWAAFQRQEQALLVLPDVHDDLVKRCRAAGDNAWGQAHNRLWYGDRWEPVRERYKQTADRLTEWTRQQASASRGGRLLRGLRGPRS